MNIPKELQELRASVENLTKKYKEMRAMPEMDMPDDDKMGKMKRDMEDMMISMMNYTHSRISYLENAFYDYETVHQKGHLPPILGAGKMEECLKTMGLDKDYEVYKPMVAAASAKYGFEDLK